MTTNPRRGQWLLMVGAVGVLLPALLLIFGGGRSMPPAARRAAPERGAPGAPMVHTPWQRPPLLQ